MLNLTSNKRAVFFFMVGFTLALSAQAESNALPGSTTASVNAAEKKLDIPAKIQAELKKWMASSNIKGILFIDGKGKIRPVDNNGKEVKTTVDSSTLSSSEPTINIQYSAPTASKSAAPSPSISLMSMCCKRVSGIPVCQPC
ncbi:MAG: hypothetical protein NTX45_03800 [Proteobacteria bacterium]|nr:hypothetical protein [Pseudomonadota bacterium]